MGQDRPRSQLVTHRIDADDVIVFIDEPWVKFARDNGASQLTPATVIGRPLWDFIADFQTRSLYAMLLKRIRDSNLPEKYPFRCDAPAIRRYMEMEIIPGIHGEVIFRSWVAREEKRERANLIDPFASRSESLLTICSWCKKVRVSDQRWVEVEAAIRRFDLFGDSPVPMLTHGICPDCLKVLDDG